MPIYEYVCLKCDTRFDALRSMREADSPIECSQCESEQTSRAISLFAAHSGGHAVAGGGNGCGSCKSGGCANCRA